jgi:hypothetical protein
VDEYEDQIKLLQQELDSKKVLQDLIFLNAKDVARQEVMAECHQRVEELCVQAEQDAERRAYHMRVQLTEMQERGYEWGGSDEDSNGECSPEPYQPRRGEYSPRSPLSYPPDTPADAIMYSPTLPPRPDDEAEEPGEMDLEMELGLDQAIGGGQTMYSPSLLPRSDDMDVSGDENAATASNASTVEQQALLPSAPSTPAQLAQPSQPPYVPSPSALPPSAPSPSAPPSAPPPSAGQGMEEVPEASDSSTLVLTLDSTLVNTLGPLASMQPLPSLASLVSNQPPRPPPTAPPMPFEGPPAPPVPLDGGLESPLDGGLPSFDDGLHFLNASTAEIIPAAMTAIVAAPELQTHNQVGQQAWLPPHPITPSIEYILIGDDPDSPNNLGMPGSPLLTRSPIRAISPFPPYQADANDQMVSPRTASPFSDSGTSEYHPDSDPHVMSDSSEDSSDMADSEDEAEAAELRRRAGAQSSFGARAVNQPSPPSVRVTRARAHLAQQAALPPVSPQASNIIHALLSPTHLDEEDRRVFDFCAFSDAGMQQIKEQSLPMQLAFNFDNVCVGRQEFNSLKSANRWLSDGVLKAYSKIIMLRNDRVCNDRMNRVVILDPQFSVRLAQADRDSHLSLVPWVTKQMTDQTTSFVLPTYFAMEKHWYSVIVEIDACKIWSVETIDNDHTFMIGRVKEFFNLYWSRISFGRPLRAWTVKQLTPPRSPRQFDTFNCGVFTCVIMDLYCIGIKFKNMKKFVNNRNIADIRKRMTLFMDGFNYK